jgi:hypothetical protein
MSIARELFGSDGASIIRTVDSILPRIKGTAIEYYEGFFRYVMTKDAKLAEALYVTELISRAFVAASASLSRFRQWSRSIEATYVANSYLGFAASIRGLLESAADSMYSLEPVATTFGQEFDYISSVMAGNPSCSAILFGELEERLIHFYYASHFRRRESVLPGHKALSSREYIEIIQKFDPNLGTLYTELCELVHPAAASLAWMFEEASIDEVGWTFEFLGEGNARRSISRLLDRHRVALLALCLAGCNYPLVTLKLLRALQLDEPALDFMDEVDLSGIPIWSKLAQKIEC